MRDGFWMTYREARPWPDGLTVATKKAAGGKGQMIVVFVFGANSGRND